MARISNKLPTHDAVRFSLFADVSSSFLLRTLVCSFRAQHHSFLALFIVTRFAQQGYSVEVWDADPQGSASEWAQRAEERSDELPFEVEPINLPGIKKKKVATQFTFIDSPPQNESILNAIAQRSDLVIIPTAPTGMDIERVLSTVSSMPDGKPIIVLLTDANPRYVLY